MGNVYNMVGGGGGIKLVSIAVTTPPTKTRYLSGESFDPAGMVVTATYSNGAKLAATGYAVEPSGPLLDGRDECHDPIYRGRKERHSLSGRDRDPETRLDCSHNAANKDGVSLRRGLFCGGNGRKGHLYGREHGGGNGLHDEPLNLYLPRESERHREIYGKRRLGGGDDARHRLPRRNLHRPEPEREPHLYGLRTLAELEQLQFGTTDARRNDVGHERRNLRRDLYSDL